MKLFAGIVKYVIIPFSSLVGIIYGIDTYFVERANTVVEPTRVKVSTISEDIKDIKKRTMNIEKILMERGSN